MLIICFTLLYAKPCSDDFTDGHMIYLHTSKEGDTKHGSVMELSGPDLFFLTPACVPDPVVPSRCW